MLHYSLAFPDPRNHRIAVTLTFTAAQAGSVALLMPVWIPGSYLVREFARHVIAVSASTTRRGRQLPLPVVKEAKNRWVIEGVAANDPITVCYELWAHERSVRESFLSDDRVLLNGTSLFLVPEGRLDETVLLDLALPPAHPEWTVATTLLPEQVDANGAGRYRAHDYHELVDTPITMGPLLRLPFAVQGIPHEVVVTGHTNRFDAARLIRDLSAVCATQIAFFGAAPFDRYLFHLHVTDEGYGGLEHRNSSVLVATRTNLPWEGMVGTPEGYRQLLGLFSHEYFHAWLVKRLRPREYRVYHYFAEQPTRLLWLFEGWTAYYDNLFLRRAGVIDPATYLGCLAEELSRVVVNPGHQVQSLTDASFDAWIKFYRAHDHSASLFANYYTLGAIVACALDWRLRERGSSLDEVVQALWRAYGHNELGVSEEEVFAMVEAVGERAVAEWLRRQVTSPQPEPLTRLAKRMGLVVETECDPFPNLGIRWHEGERARGRLVVAQVLAGSSAEEAGLSPHDEVVAIDGVQVTPATWEKVCQRYSAGERVTIHFFREGLLRARQAVFAEPAVKRVRIACAQRAAAKIRARRAAWLALSEVAGGEKSSVLRG